MDWKFVMVAFVMVALAVVLFSCPSNEEKEVSLDLEGFTFRFARTEILKGHPLFIEEFRKGQERRIVVVWDDPYYDDVSPLGVVDPEGDVIYKISHYRGKTCTVILPEIFLWRSPEPKGWRLRGSWR